jgi:catechol 2,3-dioxygenase-like lactoylglutathione lyase family enzyme
MNQFPTKLRVARPSDDLAACIRFYSDGLGMEVLGEFFDHEGFDGVMIGGRGYPWHLEFTRKKGHASGRSPGEDNLLVLYCRSENAVDQIATRMRQAGFDPVASFNPYWDRCGLTYEDHDGYRVVLTSQDWTG